MMAAGNCKAAFCTDEGHGYGCEITGGACVFLYPDSRACAEQYGEGPDMIRTDCLSEDYIAWEDQIEVLRKECGIELEIRKELIEGGA